MSSCLIITNGVESFVTVDSAVVNDKKERIGEFAKKFYIFNNYSMFCSGDVSEVDEIVSLCESCDVEQPIEEISDHILKSNMVAIEVVVFINQEIYSINKTNLYSPIKLSTTTGNISIFACGIKTREISNTASDVYVKTKDIYEAIHETYKMNECNEIGGKISIYKVSNGKSNYVKGFFLNHKKESFIIGEAIIGKVFLGSNLYLETEDNSLKWDSNGLQIKNANIIMTNDKGKDQTLQEMIDSVEIDTSKYDNVLTADGLLDTGKMQGQILAGNNNIICLDDAQGKSLKLNENGILIANKKDSTGQFIWSTAISADGIVADKIKAGGTIQGCQLRVGESDTKYMEISEKGIIRGVIDGVETFYLAHNSQGRLGLYSPSNNTRVQLNSSYSWNLTVTGKDYQGCGLNTTGGDGLAIGSDLYILGSYTATGAKNAVVPTENYGARLLYSEESDRVYFNTYGKSETVNSQVTIEIDKIFLETIEKHSECPYHIFLTPYGDSKIWVDSITDNTITIKGEKDVKFDYSIRCVRKGYKDICLESA